MSAGIISFFVALILIPIVRQLCVRWNLYDPTGPLKIHAQPIPRLGGIAIVLALVAGIQAAGHQHHQILWPFFGALVVTWAAGFIDDLRLRGIFPAFRLAVQISAGMMLWYGGWRLPFVDTNPFGLSAVCLFCILFTNAFNFLDGSDGLCAGVAGVIATAYIALPGVTLSPFGLAVAWCLLGVSIAFLFFNFPPAKIFMGDSGSTVIGFNIAFLGLDFYHANVNTIAARSSALIFFPFLMAAIPLLDAILAVLRRFNGRASPARGDRRHFYDLLLALGWSSRKVALTCYALTAATCLMAWLGLRVEFTIALSLSALSVGILLLAAVRLGSLRTKESETQMERTGASYSR